MDFVFVANSLVIQFNTNHRLINAATHPAYDLPSLTGPIKLFNWKPQETNEFEQNNNLIGFMLQDANNYLSLK